MKKKSFSKHDIARASVKILVWLVTSRLNHKEKNSIIDRHIIEQDCAGSETQSYVSINNFINNLIKKSYLKKSAEDVVLLKII